MTPYKCSKSETVKKKNDMQFLGLPKLSIITVEQGVIIYKQAKIYKLS